MTVEVTARHLHTVGDVQEYARDRAEEIAAAFPRVEHVHVILDAEKHRQIAEVVVQAKNHIRVESEEESENLRVSVDRAMEKAERQLRRLRDKIQDHKPAMKQNEEEKARGETSGVAEQSQP